MSEQIKENINKAVVNDPSNVNALIDWTQSVNDIDNLFGYLRSEIPFNIRTTTQTSIIFDKIANDIRLIPATNPRARQRNVGKDRQVEQIAMALKFYSDDDYIDIQDIQSQRMPGDANIEESLNN